MPSHLFGQVIFWIKESSFWLLVYLLAWQLYVILFNKCIPNIQTAPAIRKKIISLLKQDYEQRQMNFYTVIDLGSGNGVFTRQIARALPFAHVIGIEANKQALFWSRMHAKHAKLNNLEYKEADFFATDLSAADAVVMYLLPPFMEDVGKKLHKDLKPGTFVASNKFTLGDGWIPRETIDVKTFYFHQKELHIYRQD